MSPWGKMFFRNINIHCSVLFLISCKFFPLKDIVTVFPHSNAQVTYVDLAVKIGQGHHRIMIYKNIVVLETSMLHAKFR